MLPHNILFSIHLHIKLNLFEGIQFENCYFFKTEFFVHTFVDVRSWNSYFFPFDIKHSSIGLFMYKQRSVVIVMSLLCNMTIVTNRICLQQLQLHLWWHEISVQKDQSIQVINGWKRWKLNVKCTEKCSTQTSKWPKVKWIFKCISVYPLAGCFDETHNRTIQYDQRSLKYTGGSAVYKRDTKTIWTN